MVLWAIFISIFIAIIFQWLGFVTHVDLEKDEYM